MRLLIALGLSLVFVGAGMGQSAGSFKTIPFKTFDEEFGPKLFIRVYLGGREFSLTQPRDWSSRVDAASQSIDFASPDGKFAFTSKFTLRDAAGTAAPIPPVSNSAQKTNAATATAVGDAAETSKPPVDAFAPFRDRVASRFPGAKIVDELPCSGRGASGHLFFFTQKLPSGAQIFRGMAFLDFEGGEIEASLTTSGTQRVGDIDFTRFINGIELRH